MVVPKYIEAEWHGDGKAVLRFHQRSVQVDESGQTKDDTVVVGRITCYLSSLNIREYEERSPVKNDLTEGSTQPCEESQPLETETYTCPPEVLPDIWQSWLIQWEAWKDIYIQLAWVQKNRKLCKPSSVEWHDAYIKEYPWILPFITEGLNEFPTQGDGDTKAEEEENVSSHVQDDDDKKKALDEAYEKFSRERYWIHLRSFLQNNGVQSSEKLKEFFNEYAHIDFYADISVDDKVMLESGMEPNKNESEYVDEKCIPDFMRDKGDTTCTRTHSTSEESEEEESEVENANVSEMNSNNSVGNNNHSNLQGKNTSSNKEEKERDILNVLSCSHEQNISESDDVDKMGTKRRQEDISKDGHSEGSEVEKGSALQSKRPRHNPELLQGCEVTNKSKVPGVSNNDNSDQTLLDSKDPDSKKNMVTVDSNKVDYDVLQENSPDSEKLDLESENKENCELVTISEYAKDKKSSKQKKKKKHVTRNKGLAWVMKYFEKEDVDNEKQGVDDDAMQNSRNTGNIFSVSESHPCVQKTQENVSCLSGTKNYEFNADKLNLKESSSQLRECFGVKELSSSLDSKDEEEEISSSLKVIASANDEGAVIDGCGGISNEECIKEEINNVSEISVDDDDDDDGDDDGDEIAQAELCKTGDDILDEKEVAALQEITERKSKFLPTPFPAVKNFLVMCASHLFSIIFPVVSRGLGFFSINGRGPLPFLRQLFGFPQLSDSLGSKKKRKDACLHKLQKWLQQVSDATISLPENTLMKEFYTFPEEREMQTFYQSVETITEDDGTSYLFIDALDLQKVSRMNGTDPAITESYNSEGWRGSHIVFDDDGNPSNVSGGVEYEELEGYEFEGKENEELIWKDIVANHKLVSYKLNGEVPPPELPQHLHKYWAQRHRLFLRYDEGIELDEESWYSVTPEMIASHHAYRCKCDVVIDAFCGSGGNAIQLAMTCNHVIAIDIDPMKIEQARQNAVVYGVEDRIEFIVGDFFKLAPLLKADVVLLSPPWGGTKYLNELVYDVKKLGGAMDCEAVMTAAKAITNNIALYLPRSSNLCQVIELAGLNGFVDLEYNYMGKKRKALTAYYGDLVFTY